MNTEFKKNYDHIRSGGSGFYEQKRGLIAVWGKEAVQFLDGMITNDMKTLADGAQMLAAFPNAQGRLVAVVRVLRHGDRFLIETEEARREKVFQNLYRFTFAGDFFVEDLSENHKHFEVFGTMSEPRQLGVATGFLFVTKKSNSYFIPVNSVSDFRDKITAKDFIQISDQLYETLRIESGVPQYGVDMDETTIVPELGLDGLISYNKGCYIGQEIIARIHFRGHVAKKLTGLIFDGTRTYLSASEINADRDVRVPSDGKNAGRITSVTFSPKLDKTIALAYVRYDYLAEDTRLMAMESPCFVKALPFF